MSTGPILVVEDDRDYATILEDLLTHEGYEVEVCHDAASAQAVFAELQPGLALIDIVLPGMNGIELCARLRRSEGPGGAVPLLMMSAVYTRIDQVRQDMIFSGATDFLVKPIPLTTLLEKVASYLTYEPPASMDGDEPSAEMIAVPPPTGRSMEPCPSRGRLTPLMITSVLHRLARDGFSGTLRALREDEERSVHLAEGVVVGADGTAPDEELGTLVRGAQLLDRRSYNRVLAWVRRERCSIAQALLDGRFVSDEAYLGLLRHQVRTRLENVLGMDGGRFEVRPGETPSRTPLEVPLAPALLAGLRRHAPLGAMEAEIRGYLSHFVLAAPAFPTLWEAVASDLGADPRPPILDGSRSLGELVESRFLPRDEMARLVWLLLTCEALTLHSEGRYSAEVPVSVVTQAMAEISPTEQAELVIHAWLQHRDHNLYQLVGGRRADLHRDLLERFERLDLGFDLEMLSPQLPDDLHEMARTLLERIEEARATLLDPARRKAYDAEIGTAEPPPAAPPPRRLVGKMLFQIGKHFVATKDFGEAVRAFSRASERRPGSPEIKAHLGWATYRDARERGLRDAAALGLAFLEDALRIDRSVALAHYFTGVIHQDRGELGRAQNAFYLAVSYNPGFEPAQRALKDVIEAQNSNR